MIIFVSLLVALVGVLMYALATNAKLIEIGRMCFWVGLLAFLMRLEPQMLTLLK